MPEDEKQERLALLANDRDDVRVRDTAIWHRGRAPDPVFLVLYPDAIARQSVARLAYYVRDKHRLKGEPLGQHRYHVTLRGFCDYADLTNGMIDAIAEAIGAVGMPPFLISLDYVETFAGGAVVLRGEDGLAGVLMFWSGLTRGLSRQGLAVGRKSYTPHLTMLYDKRPVPMQAVEEIRWTARECVLVHSPWGGCRHIPIARWKLGPRLVAAGRGQA